MSPLLKLILMDGAVVVGIIIIISGVKVTRQNYCDSIKQIKNIVYGRND